LKNEAIGWIGTGTMGAEMLGRLANAGVPVLAYNRTRSKAEAVLPKASVVSSPAELARSCSTVFLCLTGLPAAEEVLFGASGLVSSGAPLAVIDTSTVGPDFALAVHAKLKAKGISYVECPVSGGPEGARAGTLTAVLSGEAAAVEAARPLVAHFAAKIHVAGGPGAAQMMKVLNNQAEGINMLAAAEVIALGLKAGLELEAMRTVLSDLRGYSKYMDLLFMRLLEPSDKTSTSLAVRVKDLGLAVDLAKRHDVPSSVSQLALELYGKASASVGSDKDQSRCFDLMGAPKKP
jgi:3-hydroxyisobutyrate dehydrogenase-like beta-hydroxyacid dehydrogenase